MKIAILICGQLRNIDFTIHSFNDYISDEISNEIDVFIATQDLNCIKPRLGCSRAVNQYILQKINYDISEKLQNLFGDKLKKSSIRNVHDIYLKNQETNFVLKNTLGWAENFQDLNNCIDLVKSYEQENNIKYDLYIKTRPDIIYCNKLKIPLEIPNKSMFFTDLSNTGMWDTVFYMDYESLNIMKGFYDYYMNFNKFNLDKYLQWKCLYNCENQLDLYTNNNGIRKLSIEKIGFPMGWLVSDIKNNDPLRRHLYINQRILDQIIKYSNDCTPMIIDVHYG